MPDSAESVAAVCIEAQGSTGTIARHILHDVISLLPALPSFKLIPG
ncbi:MAG TPA: hypothetical protein PLY87_26575 [Planctomycetaceae bacterium]|nr:hypothetical protein [Planctomycetaceae bacterium]